jgi:uncharacterized protein (TIGR02145 family)
MKKFTKIRTYPLAIMGVILTLSSSCTKKDDTPSTSQKDPVITWANPADISYGTLLSATQLNATADVPGTFNYTPATGTKLNEGANQELKVNFTPTNATTHNEASKTVKINVNGKTNPVITWVNPADISFGTLLSNIQLNAISNVTGVFVYTPAVGTKLNEGTNQDLKVDFTPTDATTYNTASKTVKINVTSSTVSGIIFNPNLTYGTMTDIDENVYKTITIGTQTWMAENLRTTHFSDGAEIPNVKGGSIIWANVSIHEPAWCTYENTTNVDSINVFGRLYNWRAVNTGKLAPNGWHVSTNAEWQSLFSYIVYNGSGDKMKETGTTHWSYPNDGATNETGFTALPAGLCGSSDGLFYGLGADFSCWTSTPWNNDAASIYIGVNMGGTAKDRTNGFSVRCVKD